MTKINVQQKERYVQNAKSLTIFQECANRSSKSRKEKRQVHGVEEEESEESDSELFYWFRGNYRCHKQE